ncbi:MAG TPA: hypothetical protein VIQ80_00900 [Candidatus Saccharimonadales bacterium]
MSDKKHLRMLDELYAHPIAHNLEWVELIPALASIGVEHTEKNGSHHFTRNGHTVAFEHRDALDEEEIMKLRHFLRTSTESDAPNLAGDMILAIDHHKAVVFRDPGTTFESRVEEHADLTKGRILHTRPTSTPFRNSGPEIDEDYYDSIVEEMAKAKSIAILSHGTSSSNAAMQLLAKIRDKNPELLHRIAAIKRCDLEAMSEPQMESLGKKLLGSK